VPRIHIRFYAELNDFLPRERRGARFEQQVSARGPLRDIIEGLGVPHTEVDLVLADGESVPLDHVPEDGARISVYPMFEAFDIATLTRIRPVPLREPRFVLDVHLGRLCAYLRMAGFDVSYATDTSDEALANIAARERRILLTRDQGLLKRKIVTHGSWIRNIHPHAQLAEVIRRFDLARLVAPFTRCLRCNVHLRPARPEEVEEHAPPRVRERQHEYSRCPDCGRVYWDGSHHARMRTMLANILA
jgi:uncharacterized protein with PIN domain